MISNIELIRRIPLFNHLSVEQAEIVAQSVFKRQFRRGEFIVGQGERSRHMYVLLTGRAQVFSMDYRGRTVILATLTAGDHLGEMSLIDGEPHSASVVAEATTDCMVIGQAEFERFLPPKSTLAYGMLRGLTRRLRVADRKIESLALMDVEGRVARALVDSAKPTLDGKLIIHNKLTRQTLSKMVGASREMVGKVIKDFADRDWISATEENRWEVNPNIESLCQNNSRKGAPPNSSLGVNSILGDRYLTSELAE